MARIPMLSCAGDLAHIASIDLRLAPVTVTNYGTRKAGGYRCLLRAASTDTRIPIGVLRQPFLALTRTGRIDKFNHSL